MVAAAFAIILPLLESPLVLRVRGGRRMLVDAGVWVVTCPGLSPCRACLPTGRTCCLWADTGGWLDVSQHCEIDRFGSSLGRCAVCVVSYARCQLLWPATDQSCCAFGPRTTLPTTQASGRFEGRVRNS